MDALQRPQEEALSDPIPPFAVAAVLLSRSGFSACTRHRGYHHDANYATRRLDPHRAGVRSDDTYHLVDPDLHMPPIGTTRADAERALGPKWSISITGFPFVTEVDRVCRAVRADLAMLFVAPSAWCRCTP